MSRPKNLSDVDTQEFRQFLGSFDTILCDCDGVLIFLSAPIEGASEVLDKLKTVGKRIRYVTNNCTKGRKKFTQLMQLAGYDLKEEEIVLPIVAIIDYLKSINFNKKLFMLTLANFKQDLIDAGFELADTGPPVVSEDVKEVLAAVYKCDPDVGAVIIDLDVNMNFIKLQRAIFYLKNPNVQFIAAAQDPLLPATKDIHLIGSVYFQNIIKAISGKEPLVFGKPSQHLSNFVNKKFDLNPTKTLFIGDTFGDMVFAKEAGYQKLLVLSGIINKEDMDNCTDPTLLPDYYLHSLADLKGLLDGIEKEVPSSL